MEEKREATKPQKSNIDISDLRTDRADDGEWLELEHPKTGAPTGIKIKLLGVDSDAYNKQSRKNQDRRLKKRKFKVTSDELENENIELLVMITKEWESMIENGQPVEFNVSNVRRIYGDKKYSWIREQVDEFAGDRNNFLGK